jgi:hypothetical protein
MLRRPQGPKEGADTPEFTVSQTEEKKKRKEAEQKMIRDATALGLLRVAWSRVATESSGSTLCTFVCCICGICFSVFLCLSTDQLNDLHGWFADEGASVHQLKYDN